MRDRDELLRRYLLGRLETEERDLLEERLLREEDLLEEAEAAEADLLDDYAHDRLAPEEREQVAHRLASSPRGRARLALVQGLGRIANERNGRVLPFQRRELSRFERAAALAAMLTLAVLSAWVATRTTDLVSPTLVAGTPAPAPAPSEPAPRPVPPVEATPLPPREEIAESTPPEAPAPGPAAPLVLQLALTTLRGEEEIPVRNVPSWTERVQLHLLLDEADKDAYASFQATVRGPGPELRAAGLEAREIEGRWTLVLDLDPQLPEGRYEVEVSGVTSAGEVEPIGFKELEVQRNASAAAGTPD